MSFGLVTVTAVT